VKESLEASHCPAPRVLLFLLCCFEKDYIQRLQPFESVKRRRSALKAATMVLDKMARDDNNGLRLVLLVFLLLVTNICMIGRNDSKETTLQRRLHIHIPCSQLLKCCCQSKRCCANDGSLSHRSFLVVSFLVSALFQNKTQTEQQKDPIR
jgi:hypothetical protein